VLETQAMIPDTAARLRSAMEDLQIIVDDSLPEETSSSEFDAAKRMLADASATLMDEE
jgi:hypothetical protein